MISRDRDIKTMLRTDTSICTMSIESPSDWLRREEVIHEAAEKYLAGLITYAEAKRIVFEA